MDFGLNEEQQALQSYAREFLTKECPASRVREAMATDTAHDVDLWKHMAELGWTGVAIPEAHGGMGMTYVDLAFLLEETGRSLVPGPLFSSQIGAVALMECGVTDQLAAIASGDHIAVLAYTETTGRLTGADITVTASGGALSGVKRYVPDAHVADTIVVAATDGLYTVAASDCTIDAYDTIDATRRWCEVRLDGAPATRIGGLEQLERIVNIAIALQAAESVGGAQHVLDMSVEYAKTRHQFGQPIGVFQAVKHRCADMLVDVEMARSAAWYAAWAASDGPDELSLAASVTKACVGEAYPRVAASGIQVHGGIGFTWESDLHLYFKRAKANEVAFGDPAFHRERVARLMAA